ncbi:MAG: hypothetical protein ABFE08_10070, partial [Armatimonadia bacterium]
MPRSTLPVLALLLLALTSALAQPVDLEQATSRVVIQSDGKARITYTIQFKELESGRTQIKNLGKLTPSHKIISSTGFVGTPQGASFPVTLTSRGGGDYGVTLGQRTENGQTYLVRVVYQTSEPIVDHTKVKGQDYLAVSWAPPQWNLSIGLQQIDIITPFALPAGLTKPEQVTDDVVRAAGLLTEKKAFGNFDDVDFYPTPDNTGKSYLSVHLKQTNPGPEADAVVTFF